MIKSNTIEAPRADKIDKVLEKHEDIRVDPYYWMNDRENPEVIDYLERENAYFEAVMEKTNELQEGLFKEMKARIKEDDTSVPYFYNGYYYITRYETGKDYPIYTRRKESMKSDEEVLFDVNEMAKDYAYYYLRGISISPDNKWAAYAVDTLSRRNYIIHVKNLETGEVIEDAIPQTTGTSTWGNDNKTLFYARKDAQSLRPNQIYRHSIGERVEDDELLYTEEDETYVTYVYKTRSRNYIVIGSSSTLSDEFRILDANTPLGEFRLFQERIPGLEFQIEHYDDYFYVLTNKDKARNFKIMKTQLNQTSKDNWIDVIPHRKDVLVEGLDLFEDYMVISERNNGLNKIRVIDWEGEQDYYLPFKSETYRVNTMQNPEFNTTKLRYAYTSLTTPASVIEFDMATKETVVLKEQEVLGGSFDKENYIAKRLWATARDGKKIPLSMVYHKETKLNKNTPLLQYGYGSYGVTIDPSFSSIRLSLLDRGFIYVIAHVRGSEYLGREWYDSGKMLNKKNTFTDFIDVSKFLIEEGYTSSDNLYAMGGSAGGLLMGAVMNMEPKLYNGVIAQVPFVDVLTTMLDDSIPLTTGEYDEWGNPNDKTYYDYIKSYSPYDNVEKREYPNTLITTGFHDSQVQYWEPAKWISKLRDNQTGEGVLLLKTNMDTGHSGGSGRFESIKEVALEYSFILNLEGIED
ncbi:MAG TPA: S9 family peptidase [Flavobacteriaceae bacterium]|nr:S9 family peptidase [Flavobacteriaceae bacterium]